MEKGNITTADVRYHAPPTMKLVQRTESVKPIGIDTEAYTTGECFMIATALGEVWTPDQWPQCAFARKYRGKVFVAYNLKYDEGALLQHLSEESLNTLRLKGKVEENGYSYRSIPKKMLSIRRGQNAVTIYDVAGFFGLSLDAAARSFLGRRKSAIPTVDFYPAYVASNWDRIATYCINDAELCQELALELIKRFESFGVFPQKLYSTAYMAYQYFASKCDYVTVWDYWCEHRDVLDMAMAAYAGGKFEVTEKGVDHYWEYDINSAYPYEIANLADVRGATVIHSTKYQHKAMYAFLQCDITVPTHVFSPVPLKLGTVNVYPTGRFQRTITKGEYDYLVSDGATIEILKGVWLRIDNPTYPYKEEIERLYAEKNKAKHENRKVDYHIIKIFLNSLYGKFVQLVKQGEKWRASACWNPIYGAIITANTRISVSKLQRIYPSVVAVHTDSVLSTSPLDIAPSVELGAFSPTVEGDGVILGSGIYQIGKKVKLRGFNAKQSLMDMLNTPESKIYIRTKRPYSWRQVIMWGWKKEYINRFEQQDKVLTPDFDRKRLWLYDWECFQDVLDHKVISLPLQVSKIFGFVIPSRRCEDCGCHTQDWVLDIVMPQGKGRAEGWQGGTYVERVGKRHMAPVRKRVLCVPCYQSWESEFESLVAAQRVRLGRGVPIPALK